jgi:regulator of protease activity HflC (stomatin/prohibitin superfamily)
MSALRGARVEAAVFYRIVDPVKAVVAIRDYGHAVLPIPMDLLDALREAQAGGHSTITVNGS